jgi:hypothetical protein
LEHRVESIATSYNRAERAKSHAWL